MPFVVLSYREDYDETTRGSSSFAVQNCETEEEVVDFITTRIQNDLVAPYRHYVLESWEDLRLIGRYGTEEADGFSEERSISFPGAVEVDYDRDDWEERLEVQKRQEKTFVRVRDSVKARLADFKAEIARKEKERREQKEAKKMEEKEAWDRKQFKELKKRFEPES